MEGHDDAALDVLARDLLKSSVVFDRKNDHGDLIRFLATRLGRTAAPRFLKVVATRSINDSEAAARAIEPLVHASDLPRLRRVIEGHNSARAGAAMVAVPNSLGCSSGLWTGILRESGQKALWTEAVKRIEACGWRASPALARAWANSAALREPIMNALSNIWRSESERDDLPPDDRKLKQRYFQAATNLILAAIRHSADPPNYLVYAAEDLRLASAVPLLERRVNWKILWTSHTVGRVFVRVDNSQARAFLSQHLRSSEAATRAGVGAALVQSRGTWAREEVLALLDDRAPIPCFSHRVCDEVLREIAHVARDWPDAPPPTSGTSVADRDQQLAAWVAFLRLHPEAMFPR